MVPIPRVEPARSDDTVGFERDTAIAGGAAGLPEPRPCSFKNAA
jgi:hypothetical protein